MSHALVTVIIPKNTKDIEAKVTELLAPYDESTSVEEYKVDCWCIDKGKPDPKCIECKGTGQHKTNYNPRSKWDWWVIGGRFDGKVSKSGKPRTSEDGGFNFGEEHHQIEHNSCLDTNDLLQVYTFRYRYPDGSARTAKWAGGMVNTKKKLRTGTKSV